MTLTVQRAFTAVLESFRFSSRTRRRRREKSLILLETPKDSSFLFTQTKGLERELMEFDQTSTDLFSSCLLGSIVLAAISDKWMERKSRDHWIEGESEVSMNRE